MFSDTCPPSQGSKIDDFEEKMKIAPTRAQNVMISKKNTILYSVYCAVYTVLYVPYSMYCTVYTVQYILYSIYRTVYTVQRTFGVFLRNHHILCPCGPDLHFFFEIVDFRPLAWRTSARKQSPRSPEGPTYCFLHRILQIRNSVPGSWELITRSTGSRRSRGFPGSGTEAADRTLGNTRRSLRMT